LFMRKLKVCIAFSAGGHFVEAMNACESLLQRKDVDVIYVTYKTENIKKGLVDAKTAYVQHPYHCFAIKRFILFLINIWDSLQVFLKHKPDVVISTGADVTVGIMLISKVFRRKLIYIESGASVNAASLTGRLAYPMADLFLVQWPDQLKRYPKAVLGGSLL